MKHYILIPLLWVASFLHGQDLRPVENYLKINAQADDPLYTTYAAAMARSRMYGDKAYKMDYYSSHRPVTYESDQAGSMYCIWKINEVAIMNTGEFFRRPVVTFSFPDMAIMEYEPVRGIAVKETFFVFNSAIALVDLEVRNTSRIAHEVALYPILETGNDSLEVKEYDYGHRAYRTFRYESPYRLISSLKTDWPYPTQVQDLFTASPAVFSYGAYSGDMKSFYQVIKTDFYSPLRSDSLNMKKSGYHDFIALHLKKRLRPGEVVSFRYMRGVIAQHESADSLMDIMDQTCQMMLRSYYDDNLILYSRIPRINFRTKAERITYISAFNLARGCFYPPSGKTRYNFYVFSRNPLWGWGHGHQVLHESLSMLAYVYLDPKSAQASQRVYMEQQRDDGLIAYRHGPRGLQDYPHKGMSTTSAPFFNWINWEIYQVGRDRQFLEEAYQSGVKYQQWLSANRDTDGDGTYEWGPYGIIENVRDWYNAVFQVSAERYLDVDKEDISDELECLDLSLMMVKEQRSLALMASALGKASEARRWNNRADTLSMLINDRMWEDSTGFYYSVDKASHGWYFMTRDLRRQEIIGFLPLWAGVATTVQAEKLMVALTDTNRFWRRYGVPTLSAADPWYSPDVDYCCKWNGPVWLLWDYLVYRGLKDYGYNETASKLAGKMLDAAMIQLSKNHNFWESYSPDYEVLNCPSNYIWDAILAKLLIEEYQ